jgi:arginyl-tRNA synthetase
VTPEQLALAIRAALQDAVDAGDLQVDVPDTVRVERPRSRAHGDWSTNIALQLAKRAGVPPRELATVLADRLAAVGGSLSVGAGTPTGTVLVASVPSRSARTA